MPLLSVATSGGYDRTWAKCIRGRVANRFTIDRVSGWNSAAYLTVIPSGMVESFANSAIIVFHLISFLIESRLAEAINL